MRGVLIAVSFSILLGLPPLGSGEETAGARPLVTVTPARLRSALPPDTHPLIETTAIEQFLDALEGGPPDWAAVYGHGHHDPNHDERLFNLNRERDAKREGNPSLQKRITFVWPGQLSYDPQGRGFRVAVGPKFNSTRWGVVRFKPEDLPANLEAIPSSTQRTSLRKTLLRGKKVEITVVMTGRLIPEESIVYDFSHDQEGLGLIMPVVRVEQIDYLMIK
jgi:hypothetical protein